MRGPGVPIKKAAITILADCLQMYFKILGVYEAIERLATIVVRIVLAPLEESAAIHFASQIRRCSERDKTSKTSISIIEEFLAIVRIILLAGIVILAFAFPYAPIVVRIYGGRVLADTEGSVLS